MFKKEEPTKKSDHTREKLFKTAMKLFSDKGFDATTMRKIATEADVALGSAYYYFDNKESLVYEYYRESHAEHEKVVSAYLVREKNFSKRLHFALKTKIELTMPYKEMARALFRVAANPESPLSPFSEESRAIRVQAIDLFKEVVEGSSDKFHADLKKMMPQCLWMYQMGIILFWIYDESKDSVKTFELIDKTVPLIDFANRSIQSPISAPFRKKVISTLSSFIKV